DLDDESRQRDAALIHLDAILPNLELDGRHGRRFALAKVDLRGLIPLADRERVVPHVERNGPIALLNLEAVVAADGYGAFALGDRDRGIALLDVQRVIALNRGGALALRDGELRIPLIEGKTVVALDLCGAFALGDRDRLVSFLDGLGAVVLDR